MNSENSERLYDLGLEKTIDEGLFIDSMDLINKYFEGLFLDYSKIELLSPTSKVLNFALPLSKFVEPITDKGAIKYLETLN